MPFNPTEFYEFASWMKTKIPENGAHPAVIRSIISRAYYAAILNASDVTGIPTIESHGRVIRALKDRRMDMGNSLHALKVLREKADYETELDVSPDDAKKALRDAKRILIYLNKRDCPAIADYFHFPAV